MVVVKQLLQGSTSSIDEIVTSKEEELKLVMIRLYKQIMWPMIHVDPFADDNNRGLRGSTSSIDELSTFIASNRAAMDLMIRIYKETICPMIYGEINAKHQNFLSKIGENFGVNLLTGMPWSVGNTASTSGSQVYQLKFINGISSPVSTKTYIKGKDNKPFILALVDVNSGETASSSMEVEIVVLDVDSNDSEAEICNSDKFNSKIIWEWNGTKVLQGNTFVKLKDGFFNLDKISFTHNSTWKGIRKCRMGARPANGVLCNSVKEAISELVLVTDKRNLLFNKHKIPSLSDDVYRLNKICRRSDCYDRLNKANIITVMDLLTLNAINPKRLKEILDVRHNTWKIIIDHAQMCKDDNGIYLYYDPKDGQTSNGVVFNISKQLVGLIAESQFVPCYKLCCDKKADAQKLILSSSENWNKVVSFNNLASFFTDFQPNTILNPFCNSLNVVIPQTIDTTPIFPIKYTNNESNLEYDNIGIAGQSQSPKRPASGNVISISPKKRRDNHFPMSPSTPSVGSSSRMTNTNVTKPFNQCQKPSNVLTSAIGEDDDYSQFLDLSQYDIPAQRWKMVWRVVGWIFIFSKVRKRRMTFCDQYLFLQPQIEHVQRSCVEAYKLEGLKLPS